jgi:hypothetical protein
MSSENQEVAVQEQPSVLSGEPKTETPQTTTDWKVNLSDEIRADKSLENIKDIQGLAKSYIHAQKMVGADKIPVPNKYATEDDWNEVYSKLGRPESPDGYSFDTKGIDESGLKSFAEHAHKMGLLPQQANEMVKWYQGNVDATTQENNTKAEKARNDSVIALKKEYGQAYDNKLKAASAMAKQYIEPDVLNLNMADGTKLGDHPSIIKAFASLSEKMGEDQFVNPSGPSYLTPEQLNKQIGELTATGSAYWDKNHPNHKTAVQEVLALREQKNNV